MKILFPLEYNFMTGMLFSVHLLAEGLLKQGVQVGIFVAEKGDVSQAFKKLGCEVFIDPDSSPWLLAAKKPLASWSRWKRFRKEFLAVIDEWKPDIVHTNALLAQVYCSACNHGVPSIHNQRADEYRGVSRWALKRGLQKSDLVVVTTKYQEGITRDQLGVPLERQTLIPNATQLHHEPASSRALRETCGLTDDNILLSCVGVIAPRKNQLLLLKVMTALVERHPHVHVLFAGRVGTSPECPPYMDRLESFIQEYHLESNVTFGGFINDRVDLMESTDILVHPAKREGFGRIIIEAWARHRPVVVSDGTGPATFVDHGENGFICPLDDIQPWVESISQLIENPKLRNQMAQHGYEKVLTHYDADAVAKQYYQCYQRLVEQSNPR